MNNIQVLVFLNAGTLGAILLFGFKVIRFFNRIELKTDILWEDYEERIKDKSHHRSYN